MNLLRAIFEFLLGTGWKDPIPPVTDPPLTEYLAPCLRPVGDPKRLRHWYGRNDGRGDFCLRCGTPNPYKRPAAPPAVREETP